MNYSRFAIYFTPKGPLAEFGASWLGWDIASGAPARQPRVEGVDVAHVTGRPRKYGFHGTLKPPLRLADGTTQKDFAKTASDIAARHESFVIPRLRLARLGHFLALVPDGPVPDLVELAADLVMGLDGFRAPASEAELARRKSAGLTPTQEAYLDQWGYPYVMDEFRFHLTLTGPLEDPEAVEAAIAARLPAEAMINVPVVDVTLCGEADDGFHALHRIPLSVPVAP